jgi:hypothetical protein
MTFRAIPEIAMIFLIAWQPASAQSRNRLTVPARKRATAKITVQSSEAKPFDQTAGPG